MKRLLLIATLAVVGHPALAVEQPQDPQAYCPTCKSAEDWKTAWEEHQRWSKAHQVSNPRRIVQISTTKEGEFLTIIALASDGTIWTIQPNNRIFSRWVRTSEGLPQQ